MLLVRRASTTYSTNLEMLVVNDYKHVVGSMYRISHSYEFPKETVYIVLSVISGRRTPYGNSIRDLFLLLSPTGLIACDDSFYYEKI